jgi:hypothetical protein
MMTCSRNLSKHFFYFYQTKPIGKCCNMNFNFLQTYWFFSLKNISSSIPFSCLFFTFVQIYTMNFSWKRWPKLAIFPKKFKTQIARFSQGYRRILVPNSFVGLSKELPLYLEALKKLHKLTSKYILTKYDHNTKQLPPKDNLYLKFEWICSLQLGKSILSSSNFWCCYIVPYLIWHSQVWRK